MKRNILILILFFIGSNSFSQEDSKQNINVIIIVNDKIPFKGDLNLQVEVDENNKKDTLLMDYTPGNISLNKYMIEKLQSENVKSITLLMRYMKQCKGETKSYNYRIEFKKAWLQYSFTVIRFYNLDNKVNKKTFYPLEGTEYTYEVDTPDGSQTRVRKRNSKVTCN